MSRKKTEKWKLCINLSLFVKTIEKGRAWEICKFNYNEAKTTEDLLVAAF